MQSVAGAFQLDAGFYDLLMEASGAAGNALVAARAGAGVTVPPVPPLLQVKRGKAESAGWYLVQAAEFAPEPLTIANLRVRDTYASVRVVGALLEMMTVEGWLARDEHSAYYLSEPGRTILANRRALAQPFLIQLESMVSVDLARLSDLLARLIGASLSAERSVPPWCLAHSRRRAPDQAAGTLAAIVQYFDDFNAFRDDAHMAAWQPLGIEGYVWEAFAHVCDGSATTSAGLWELLAHRGYARCDYAWALAGCARRGWLRRAEGDSYTVTDAGQAVRAEVEWHTDDYFYAPWRGFSEAAIAETHALLMNFRDELINQT
jgi:helix-turn-helix protein